MLLSSIDKRLIYGKYETENKQIQTGVIFYLQ